jgi:hypothetical protein
MTDRRQFLQASAAALSATALPLFAVPKASATPTAKSAAETAVKALYDSLTDEQKKAVCFTWDHTDPKRGLLRTRVANNWNITPHMVKSEFFTKEQQGIVGDIFKGLVNPEWQARFLKQMKDDSGGKPFGSTQSFAIFGEPGTDKFEFVLTGRHQTIRADGNSEKSVAFGGPIFYGHAGKGDSEEPHHPDNVFWSQAVVANGVYKLLDDKQRKRAVLSKSPSESAVAFRGDKISEAKGLPIAGLTGDVQKELQKVLEKLIEPFRAEDRDEALACLKTQGGLDKCVLSFYEDEDIGDDQVWDNWRIEGPSFVWYFRGSPHVHVWVNIADDPKVKLNA